MLSRRAAALGLLTGIARSAPARPNIVLFWSEGHAASGLTAAATPHLHRMAAEGLRMSAAFTPEAMGSPSLSSLLTGLYPLRHGAYEEFSFIRRNAGKTWPLWFQESGYRVTLAGVPAFGPRLQFPFDYQPLSSPRRYLRLRHEKPFCLVVILPPLDEYAGETPDAVAPPPYAVDTPATRKWMGRYMQALRGMDAWIGETLADIGGNTITLYASAHGPSLPFAKWSLYDAGIRVPLLVRWPGVVRPGESQAMVSLMDVLPTLVEACGSPPPPGLDGRSFLNLLTGRTTEHRSEIFAVHHNRGSVSGSDCPSRTIRTRRFKYIANLKHWNQFGNIWWRGNDGSDSRNPVRSGPPAMWREWLLRAAADDHAQNRVGLWRSRPAEELYDLDADPNELRNLAAEELPEQTQLRSRLVAWMKQQKDGWLSFVE
ncbi:MAG: sulfatase-like hydrolase/transferase [Bryobacterales bacterium]|nr:sulfatase-like hydrolase/transferase [Bryobacterales bacterium]